jgi:hypothetical protein
MSQGNWIHTNLHFSNMYTFSKKKKKKKEKERKRKRKKKKKSKKTNSFVKVMKAG